MKKISRLLMLPLLIGALLGGTAGPALAHYVYDGAWTYASGSNCTHQRAEVSHGSWGKGYAKVDTRSDYKVTSYDCMGDWTRPPGYITSTIRYLKWTGSYWGVCTSRDYASNTTTTDKYVRALNFGSTPCGAGYYYTDHNGYVWNGAWYGGYMSSGSYHYFS